jgi:hypothetical protein
MQRKGNYGDPVLVGASDDFTMQLGKRSAANRSDVSGARRFLPVFCGEYLFCIDLKLIKARISSRLRVHNHYLF